MSAIQQEVEHLHGQKCFYEMQRGLWHRQGEKLRDPRCYHKQRRHKEIVHSTCERYAV